MNNFTINGKQVTTTHTNTHQGTPTRYKKTPRKTWVFFFEFQ